MHAYVAKIQIGRRRRRRAQTAITSQLHCRRGFDYRYSNSARRTVIILSARGRRSANSRERRKSLGAFFDSLLFDGSSAVYAEFLATRGEFIR